MGEQQGKTVSVEQFSKELKLEILYTGRGAVNFYTINVYRPGLQLAGFYRYFDHERLLVFGMTEYEYVRSFEETERREKLEKLFSFGEIPAVIISRDLPVLPELIAAARLCGCPLFRSSKMTANVINDCHLYLNRILAPETSLHGVLLDVFGVGILLTGKSGVGKSETAVELVKRGHRLVADDTVLVRKIGDVLEGTAPDSIRYFMELRGIGIINIKSMYGSGSVLDEKSIDLIIELKDWEEGMNCERVGSDFDAQRIFDIDIPKYTIPLKPGRNTAIIIEVAARNYRLRRMGYDAASELIKKTVGK